MKLRVKPYKFKKMMIGLIIVIIGISLVPSANAAKTYNIIAFGDSITSGRPYSDLVGSGRQGYGGYEPVLEQLLGDSKKVSNVYNWGWGGETTPNGVNRIDSVLASQVSNYVIIMEGTNDQWFGVPAQTTAFNLGVMVDKCRAFGTIPILGNLTPADRDIGNQISLLYNPAIANVAQQKDVKLVDHYSAVVDRWHMLHYDPVHPNRAGYKALAETWHKALFPLMQSLNVGVLDLLLSE